jgi:acetyl esterase/lipase
MKRIHFEPETDGFYGVYWNCKNGSNAVMIAMLGDDSEDHMARCGAKWLQQLGVNVLTMAPDKKDCGYHNYPLERIEAAIAWLKAHGNEKIGVVGASATGTLALTAASYFSDITLTIGMTPSDFIWQGFMQGKRDGCKEWPVEGESLFSYQGEPLPYMPFVYQHPEYWKVVEIESKRTGDILNSRKPFDDSEKAHPLTEEEMIRVENIKGRLLLIGAADDALWDTARYIRRMEQRLKQHPHACEAEFAIYEYGTHFVFPETMLQTMMPVVGDTFVKVAFLSARQHPKECKQTRIDIDWKLKDAIKEWMQ